MFLRYLLELFCITPFTAALSLFLEFCTQEGNIFEAYGKWLQKQSDKSKRWEYWLKPIGNCVFCAGTWIFICIYLGFVSLESHFGLELIGLIPLGCGANYIWTGILQKI